MSHISARAVWPVWSVLVATAAYGASPAFAQSRRYAPEPEDYDEDSETRSEFWERAAHPNRRVYAERINLAHEYMQRRDADSQRLVVETLESAVAVAPDEPLAYWILGTVYEHQKRWRACADRYERVFGLDSRYEPPEELIPDNRPPLAALDLGLAECRAQIGEFERAIAHYQRVLSRDTFSGPLAYRRLGEAYMALGRLGEAIELLDMARKVAPVDPRVNYSLAVAYDRDEQEHLARTALTRALQQDSDMSHLRSVENWFTPAADRYYYQGLANAHERRVEKATVFFRHYLHLAGEDVWGQRAREHLRDLARLPLPSNVMVHGQYMDENRLRAALEQVEGPLQSCMSGTPGLLLEVRITMANAVKAQVVDSFATTAEQAARVLQCVETAAEHISIPRPRKSSSTRYWSVSFLVIARTKIPDQTTVASPSH